MRVRKWRRERLAKAIFVTLRFLLVNSKALVMKLAYGAKSVRMGTFARECVTQEKLFMRRVATEKKNTHCTHSAFRHVCKCSMEHMYKIYAHANDSAPRHNVMSLVSLMYDAS